MSVVTAAVVVSGMSRPWSAKKRRLSPLNQKLFRPLCSILFVGSSISFRNDDVSTQATECGVLGRALPDQIESPNVDVILPTRFGPAYACLNVYARLQEFVDRGVLQRLTAQVVGKNPDFAVDQVAPGVMPCPKACEIGLP